MATPAAFFDKAGVKVVSNASNRGINIPALAGGGRHRPRRSRGAVRRAGQDFAIRGIVQTVGKYASHVVVKQYLLRGRK